MKLLALVTLYYPPAHITDNLLTYAEDVDGLFVWDNTPGGSNYQFPESISHKIVRLRQGENTGIGKALNAAAMFALDNGYTYLLTMDQDSAFTASTFKDYIRIINNDKDSSHFAYIPLSPYGRIAGFQRVYWRVSAYLPVRFPECPGSPGPLRPHAQ